MRMPHKFCLKPPLFTRKPGDDTGLNSGKVRINQHMPLWRNKSCADELAEAVRHGAVDAPQAVKVMLSHKVTGKGQRL